MRTDGTWGHLRNRLHLECAEQGGFSKNQQVTVGGITPSGYNATSTITVINGTRFTYPVASRPGSYVSGGWVAAYVAAKGDPVTVTSASWSSGTAYITTSNPDSFVNGTPARIVNTALVAPTSSWVLTAAHWNGWAVTAPATRWGFVVRASPLAL